MSGTTTTPHVPAVQPTGADSGASTVLTGAAWVLRAVTGPGGRDAVYGAQCTTCKQTSGQGSGVARSVGAWAVEHTRVHPEHRSYVSIVRTQWRVDPDAAPPVPDTVAAPVEPAPGQPDPAERNGNKPRTARTHHARPLLSTWRLGLSAAVWGAGVRLRRTWAWIRAWVLPLAGPLFLASLSAALGCFVGALLTLTVSGHG